MHIKMQYKLATMIIASFVYNFIPVNVLKLIMRFILWFYIGYWFENYREIINKHILNKLIYAFISGVAFAVISLHFIIPNPAGIDVFSVFRLIIKQICTVLGCVHIYVVSRMLSLTKFSKSKAFITLRNNTRGL